MEIRVEIGIYCQVLEPKKKTPNYAAIPSGPIATFMATLKVIAINYPEMMWIKPVEYSLMSVLAINMVSGKVHWASDYPTGIFYWICDGKRNRQSPDY
jgi:hypothetical protein